MLRGRASPPAVLLPLSRGTARRYAIMRWLVLATITAACVFSINTRQWWPGLPVLAAILAAYVGLVEWQYGGRGECGGALRVLPGRYMALCALLVFGMAVLPAQATHGQSLWYNVMFFVVLSEGRHLPSNRLPWIVLGFCVALVHLSVLLVVGRSDWPFVTVSFLPLDAGLIASMLGTRVQRKQEEEHVARLALLEELEASRARLEEANHQLQIFAGSVEQLAVANERNRLARDLHDILGYTLATVVVKAEAAKRLLAAEPERARQELDRVQEVARGGLAEVRRSVAGIRDSAAASGVWHEAMMRFIDDFGRETRLRVSHQIAPLPEGHDQAIEVCLFRVIQESLTNVARHAQAANVSVTLRIEHGAAVLKIADDGNGAGPAAKITPGFGLRGMRERVEQLGGRVVFSSKCGEGTHILAMVPCCPDTALRAIHGTGDDAFGFTDAGATVHAVARGQAPNDWTSATEIDRAIARAPHMAEG
jgi:signal transduction histidine kinase